MKRWIYLLLILLSITIGYAQDTEFDEILSSDVNRDGIINILDLVFVASHFDEMLSEEQSPNPDINSDGIVNFLDLTLISRHFGHYSGIPLVLTDDTFDNVVLNAKQPILVEFKSDY